MFIKITKRNNVTNVTTVTKLTNILEINRKSQHGKKTLHVSKNDESLLSGWKCRETVGIM